MIPILTTIYIPDKEHQRYEDTPSLIQRCISANSRKRIILIDKAPDSFADWAREQEHTVIVARIGAPPRMTKLLKYGLDRFVQNEFVWTIEQDVVLTDAQIEA